MHDAGPAPRGVADGGDYLHERGALRPDRAGHAVMALGPYHLVRYPIYSGILVAGIAGAVALS